MRGIYIFRSIAQRLLTTCIVSFAMVDWDKIIVGLALSNDEIKVLIKFAKCHISQNAEIPLWKIRKKVNRRIQGNIEKIIHDLIKKQLVIPHKKEVYTLTKRGLIISHILEEEEYKIKYGGLRRI